MSSELLHYSVYELKLPKSLNGPMINVDLSIIFFVYIFFYNRLSSAGLECNLCISNICILYTFLCAYQQHCKLK